jgi:hypothetical protein
MPSQLPIACSLSGVELPQRLAEMSAVGQTSLLAAEVDGLRAVLSFRAEARDQLAAIIAAEAECCAFLAMKLDDVPAAVRLVIEAPVGAESVVEDLVAAFRGAEQVAR